MIVRVHAGGRSFAGALAYVSQDKNRKTSERVGFLEVENMVPCGNDPIPAARRAARIMAATAFHAPALKRLAGVPAGGRTLAKPVYHYSLNWPPDENPTQEEMLATAQSSLTALGMDDRQAVIVEHRDRKHSHVHIVVNRVSPEDGRAASTGQDQIKLKNWAREHERDQGRIRCQRRIDWSIKPQRRQGPDRMPRSRAHRRAWRNLYNRQRKQCSRKGQSKELDQLHLLQRVKLARKIERRLKIRAAVTEAARTRVSATTAAIGTFVRKVAVTITPGIAAGQTAVTALAHGGRSAGSALARSGQTTVTALAHGGRSAGSALARSGQTTVTALAHGGRSAGSALARSGQTTVTALAHGGRSAGSALTRLSGLDDVIARRAIKKRADEVRRKFETGTPEQRDGIYEERRLLNNHLMDREHSDEYYSHSNPREEHARLEDRLRDRLNALLLSDDYLNSSPQQRNRRRDRLFTDEEPNRDQIPRRGEVDAAEAPLQALVGDVEFYGRPDGEHRPTLTPEVASRPATGSSPPAPMTGPPVHPVPASSLSYRATASSSALAKALVDAVDRNDREDLAALQSLVAYAHRSRNDRAPEAAGPARTDRTRGEETPPRAVRAEPTRPAVRGGPPVQPPPSTTPPSRRPAVRVHHPAQPRPAVRGREREPAPSATLEQELEFRKLKGLGEEAGGRAWYYKSLGKVAPGVRPGEETSEQVDQALELAFEHFRPRPRPEPAREPDPPRPARPQVKDRGRGRDF